MPTFATFSATTGHPLSYPLMFITPSPLPLGDEYLCSDRDRIEDPAERGDRGLHRQLAGLGIRAGRALDAAAPPSARALPIDLVNVAADGRIGHHPHPGFGSGAAAGQR